MLYSIIRSVSFSCWTPGSLFYWVFFLRLFCSFETLKSWATWRLLLDWVRVNHRASGMYSLCICIVCGVSIPCWFTVRNSWTQWKKSRWDFTSDELGAEGGCIGLHLPILALFLFVKVFSKYFGFLFLFLMHVPQKKGMTQTSPVSASKAQDNLRQHQLSSLLSNTLSGQPWSF